MAALPYMPFYFADYLADTMHLSREAHGTYLLLIANYWQTGKPLPDDDAKLARIVRASADEWAALRGDLEPFFDCNDGLWRHKRIDAELEKANNLIERAKAGGKASAAARAAKSNQNSTTVPTKIEHPLNGGCDLVPTKTQPSEQIRSDHDSSPLGARGFENFPERVEALTGQAMTPADHAETHRWAETGWDADRDVMPALQSLPDERRRGKRLGYFTPIIRDFIATRSKPIEPGNPTRAGPKPTTMTNLQAALDELRAKNGH